MHELNVVSRADPIKRQQGPMPRAYPKILKKDILIVNLVKGP